MKPLAEADNPTLAFLQEIRGAISKTQAKIDRVAGEIEDLRTRIDGNTLILNRVAD